MEIDRSDLPEARSEDQVHEFMKKNVSFQINYLENFTSYARKGLNKLMEAISRSTSLRTLQFDDNSLRLEDWNMVFRALAENKSITSLHFSRVVLYEDVISDLFRQMLQLNPSLKKLTFIWSSMSQSIMWYLSEALKSNSTLQAIRFENTEVSGFPIFTDALKVNNGLKGLEFKIKLSKSAFDLLDKALQSNKSITSLTFENIKDMTRYKHMENIVSYNTITSITLQSTSCQISFFKSLKTNRTLTQLHLQYAIIDTECFEAIGDLLKTNKTLTSVSFDSASITEENCLFIAVGLEYNTSIMDLSLSSNHISSKSLSEVLKTNRTLKSVDLSFNSLDPNLVHISEALKVNNSLEELYLSRSEKNNIQGALNIGDSLAINRSVRKLAMDINLQHDMSRIHLETFLNQLKHNKTLTEIDLITNQPPSKKDGKIITEIMKSNWALIRFNMFGLESRDIRNWLARNIKRQQQNKNRTLMLMKMIVLRPNHYLAVFPKEIWRLIFEKMKFPGVNVDFGDLFTRV